jgi:hypothetical protein
MSAARPFHWDRMILAALKLGIPPSEFWRLSLREWQTLTRSRSGSDFRASDLSQLIAAYPDTETHHGNRL